MWQSTNGHYSRNRPTSLREKSRPARWQPLRLDPSGSTVRGGPYTTRIVSRTTVLHAPSEVRFTSPLFGGTYAIARCLSESSSRGTVVRNARTAIRLTPYARSPFTTSLSLQGFVLAVRRVRPRLGHTPRRSPQRAGHIGHPDKFSQSSEAALESVVMLVAGALIVVGFVTVFSERRTPRRSAYSMRSEWQMRYRSQIP